MCFRLVIFTWMVHVGVFGKVLIDSNQEGPTFEIHAKFIWREREFKL